jgi:hypothetical protein
MGSQSCKSLLCDYGNWIGLLVESAEKQVVRHHDRQALRIHAFYPSLFLHNGPFWQTAHRFHCSYRNSLIYFEDCVRMTTGLSARTEVTIKFPERQSCLQVIKSLFELPI